jgi:hypothetical protein
LNDKTENANGAYTSTSYPGGSGSFIYVINGTYTINATVSFTGCSVFLAPDAQVNINSGGSLSILSNSVWKAGCGAMWNGIVINSGGTLTVDNSTVQDAKQAIDCKSGGNLTTQNQAKLLLNYKNIWLEPHTATHTAVIKNTTFSCLNTSNVPANALIAPYSGQRTVSGIVVDNVTQANIGLDASGQTNTFNNMDVGILNINSGLRSYNNSFTNITNATSGAGYCIYSMNVLSPEKTVDVGGNANIYQKNTFTNSYTGIYVSANQDASIQNNVMNNLTTGVYITGCATSGNVVSVNSNTIDDCTTGIYGYNNGGSTSITFNNNIINSSTAGSNSKPNSSGILIENSTLSSINAPALTINSNEIYRTRTGIKLTNFTLPHVEHNDIPSLSDLGSSLGSKGIAVITCPNAEVRENVINGPDRTSWWIDGINVESSSASIVVCNYVNTVGMGLHFQGSSANSSILNNAMKDNTHGIDLGWALIGPQKSSTQPSDNTWEGTFSKHTESYYSDGTLSTLYVKNLPSNTSTPSYYPSPMVNGMTGVVGTDWPITVTAVSSSYSSGQECNSREMASDPTILNDFSPEQIELFRKIAMDEITFPNFDVQTKWMSKFNLLRLMKNDSTVSNSNSDIISFGNSNANSNMNLLYFVNDLITNRDYLAANTILGSIYPVNEVEENLKSVYLVESNRTGDTLSTSQVELLNDLANQCPFSAGYAVYNARAILKSINLNAEFNNVCETVTRQFDQDKEEKPLFVSLYPNPASNSFTIRTASQVGVLKIYNALGELIINRSINTSESVISLEGISDGIYNYQFTGIHNHIHTGKLVIIK